VEIGISGVILSLFKKMRSAYYIFPTVRLHYKTRREIL
jgi:hypothetical protein